MAEANLTLCRLTDPRWAGFWNRTGSPHSFPHDCSLPAWVARFSWSLGGAERQARDLDGAFRGTGTSNIEEPLDGSFEYWNTMGSGGGIGGGLSEDVYA